MGAHDTSLNQVILRVNGQQLPVGRISPYPYSVRLNGMCPAYRRPFLSIDGQTLVMRQLATVGSLKDGQNLNQHRTHQALAEWDPWNLSEDVHKHSKSLKDLSAQQFD